ncbi:hypothetical protein [Enterococcus cecorum]|uniref:hypothetical protein n=1 Tax=Enterococcus cecorum TaxID=44008 RepID=UPI00200A93C1|nr:hypothetical protein [Enterococcus cecorum]
MKKSTEKMYVVAIPDEFTLLVKRDKNLDFNIGQKLRIVNFKDKITDPFSNEVLGYYFTTKEIIEIIHIYDNYLECGKTEKNLTFVDALSPMFNSDSGSLTRLSVNEEDVLHSFSDINPVINIGDIVITYDE